MNHVLCFLLLASPTFADDKTPAPPPPFILPPSPAPMPPPPPPPNSPVQLSAGHPYVVRLNAASVVASPEGVVKLCNKMEPVTLVDADGNDTTYEGDKSVCVVLAKSAGACELLIVGTDGTVLARVQVQVGTPPTPPPGPNPPPVPPPNDLTATFETAYKTDGPDAAGLASLTSLYKVAAAALPGVMQRQEELERVQKTRALTPIEQAGLTSIHSNADAIVWVKNAEVIVGLKPAQLPATRKAVGAELDAVLGVDTAAPLDVAKAVAEFQRVSSALQGVK